MRNLSALGALAALVSMVSCGTPPSTNAHLPEGGLALSRQALVNGVGYQVIPSGTMGADHLCLDVRGGSKDAGGILQLWGCNASDAQKFKRVGKALQALGDMCLTVDEGQNFSGGKVHMRPCEEGSKNQAWVKQGNQLRLEGTDACLEVVNGLANRGAALHVWQCLPDRGHQMFTLDALDPSEGNSRSATDDSTVKNISGRKVVWNDEFEEDDLDTDKWSRDSDSSDTDHNNGKTKEQQSYTQSEKNSYVKNGKLHIALIREETSGKAYSSARLVAHGTKGFTYGRIETRLKVPCGQGLRSVVWLRPVEASGPWPTAGEIDVAEILGGNPNTLHGTAHFGEEAPNNQSEGDAYTLSSGDFCGQFHTFAVERSKDKITWLLDGTPYGTLTPEDADFTEAAPWPFNAAFDLVLNVTMGGKWPGEPDPSIDSASLVVDYVRILAPEEEADAPKSAAHAHSDAGKEAARPKN